MEELKYVTYKHLKKGQKINGIKKENVNSGITGYVKDVNVAYVTIEKWERGGKEERYTTDWMFGIKLTDDEIRQKYNAKAGEVVAAIQNRLETYEIGYHEMWNGWLSSDPWELAQECTQKKLKVIGHCTDIVPKTAMFSEDILDAGVCVEDEDGDKFWCHFRSDSIEIMTRRYERYQEYMKQRKTAEYDNYSVAWETEEEIAKRKEGFK